MRSYLCFVRSCAIIGLYLAFTGCTGIGVYSDLMDARSVSMTCYGKLHDEPKYQPLYQKVPITGGMPSDEQLADTEKPSPEMIQLAMDWFEETQVCGKLALESYTNLSPPFGAKVAGWIAETTDIFNETMAKVPPYGYVNARVKHLRQRQREDLQQWIKEEVQRRQLRAESDPSASDFLNFALNTALQTLAGRQGAIFHAQFLYKQRVPTYRSVEVMQTACGVEGKKFVCRVVPLQAKDSLMAVFQASAPISGSDIFNGERGRCYYCHGLNGNISELPANSIQQVKRLNPKPSNLRDPGSLRMQTDRDRFTIIKHGIAGTGMIGFKDRLTDNEIESLLPYLAELRGESVNMSR